MKSYFENNSIKDIRIYYPCPYTVNFSSTSNRILNSKKIKDKLKLCPKYSSHQQIIEFKIKSKNYLLYNSYFGEIYNFIIYNYYNDDLLIFREHKNSCSFNHSLYLRFSDHFKITSCTINRESLKL